MRRVKAKSIQIGNQQWPPHDVVLLTSKEFMEYGGLYTAFTCVSYDGEEYFAVQEKYFKEQ